MLQEILVSVSLVPVADLTATATDGSSFDIAWSTPEAGQQVDIYRFATAPPAGLESEDREASVIAVEGFTDEQKIRTRSACSTPPARRSSASVGPRTGTAPI